MSTATQMQKARIWETECNAVTMPVQASLITEGFISLCMLSAWSQKN